MSELKQTLNALRGTAMLLNIVLGAGLLTLPGLAIGVAGDGAFLVWLACAAAALPLLVIFAILGRKYPNSGGLAAILKRAFGEFGYVAATFLFLGAVVFGLPAIALTGGHYASAMLGLSPHLMGAMLLLAAVGVNLISAEHAARINAALASVLLVILVLMAVVGWSIVEPDLQSLFPKPAVIPEKHIFLSAFMMVFFAFTGWEVGANLGGEFKNPNRNLPLAIFLSFGIAVILYATLAIVVQAADLTSGFEAPFATLFGDEFGLWGRTTIGLTSVLLIWANLSAAVWAVSRMVYSAAQENLLPAGLAEVQGDIPRNAICLTVGALMLVLGATWAGYLNLTVLLAIAGQNFLLLYAAAAVALVRLSPRFSHRLLGGAGIVVVGGLIAARGGSEAYYPLALILAAALTTYLKRLGTNYASETHT